MVSNDAPPVTRKAPRKGTIFPRITSACRALGVSRITLYRVLKQQLPDRQNLRTRYKAFLKKEAA